MKQKFFERSELTRHLWAFRREFLWVGFFSMVANVLMLTPTVYMLQVFDRVFRSYNELTLLAVTLVMLVLFAFMSVAEWLRSRLLVRGGVRLDEALNSLVFNAGFRRYLNCPSGNPAEPLNDLTTIRQFLTGNGIFAFFDIPWTPIYIAVIFILNTTLGWISVVFACIQVAVTLFSHRATVHDIERATHAGKESSGYFQAKLRNIEPIHAMGMSASLLERWIAYDEVSITESGVMQEKQRRQQSISKFIRYSMQSLTLGAGALMVIDAQMSAGAMIAVNVLMARALQPLDLVIMVWKPFVQAHEAFLRMEQLLAALPADAGRPVTRLLVGDVVVEDVVARVEGRSEPILHGLDAVFAAGTVTAVIGPSGSGKSTLARCLVGAWPGVSGRVAYDGEPINALDPEALGSQIGYLPQDIELFEGTIAENIARFAAIDSDKVIDSARRTGIHEMILRFPKGYDTTIGEAGSLLSGGQRQRIGLARALYGNPSVIVLDEPNSNLDDAGEKALVETLMELRASGRVVVVVTHRFNIFVAVDRLLVLKDGRIEHHGPRYGVLEALRSKSQTGVAAAEVSTVTENT